jgi:hypothetical protein
MTLMQYISAQLCSWAFSQPNYFFMEKSLLHPNYGMDYLTPSTIKRSILSPELFKTGQIIPQAVLLQYMRSCYSTDGFVFSFFIYFV